MQRLGIEFSPLRLYVFLFSFFAQSAVFDCGTFAQDFKTKEILANNAVADINYLPCYLPLTQLFVTSSFGARIHPVTGKMDFHKGVDLAAKGNLVFSILEGEVIQVGYNAILGIFIRISHHNCTSIYGHLSYILVSPGELIKGGQPIAITGATGRVTGEHLHFSIKVGDVYVDPLMYLMSLIQQ